MELMKENMVYAEEIHRRVYLWVDCVRKGIFYMRRAEIVGV
jgi:hypothetical protein